MSFRRQSHSSRPLVFEQTLPRICCYLGASFKQGPYQRYHLQRFPADGKQNRECDVLEEPAFINLHVSSVSGSVELGLECARLPQTHLIRQNASKAALLSQPHHLQGQFICGIRFV